MSSKLTDLFVSERNCPPLDRAEEIFDGTEPLTDKNMSDTASA